MKNITQIQANLTRVKNSLYLIDNLRTTSKERRLMIHSFKIVSDKVYPKILEMENFLREYNNLISRILHVYHSIKLSGVSSNGRDTISRTQTWLKEASEFTRKRGNLLISVEALLISDLNEFAVLDNIMEIATLLEEFYSVQRRVCDVEKGNVALGGNVIKRSMEIVTVALDRLNVSTINGTVSNVIVKFLWELVFLSFKLEDAQKLDVDCEAIEYVFINCDRECFEKFNSLKNIGIVNKKKKFIRLF